MLQQAHQALSTLCTRDTYENMPSIFYQLLGGATKLVRETHTRITSDQRFSKDLVTSGMIQKVRRENRSIFNSA